MNHFGPRKLQVLIHPASWIGQVSRISTKRADLYHVMLEYPSHLNPPTAKPSGSENSGDPKKSRDSPHLGLDIDTNYGCKIALPSYHLLPLVVLSKITSCLPLHVDTDLHQVLQADFVHQQNPKPSKNPPVTLWRRCSRPLKRDLVFRGFWKTRGYSQEVNLNPTPETIL